jgi:hypothetical protein
MANKNEMTEIKAIYSGSANNIWCRIHRHICNDEKLCKCQEDPSINKKMGSLFICAKAQLV